MRGIEWFSLKQKLSLRFVGPFEVVKRVGKVAYKLALPHNLMVHDPCLNVEMFLEGSRSINPLVDIELVDDYIFV